MQRDSPHPETGYRNRSGNDQNMLKPPSEKEIKAKAFENAAALIETMDLEQLYGNFADEFLDNDVAHCMEQMQKVVAFHLRHCRRR